MLESSKHLVVLKEILRDIYTDPKLQASLGFKGGTCLLIFYGLDRLSVDLDFNLLFSDFDQGAMNRIVEKNLRVTDRSDKYNTWFWMGSYQRNYQQVKVEVSKRSYPDKYITKDLYGISVRVMDPAYMFAHKLCAIIDRPKLQSRDIYDAHFMFAHNFPISEEIIKLRTGQTIQKYFEELIKFIEKNVNEKNVLNGLGDLLNPTQKNRVKATLKRDILFDLKSRLNS